MKIRETLKKTMQSVMISKHDLKDKAGNVQLIAIYLFGSFAQGIEKEKSDIDLAFVFKEHFYKEDPFAALQKAELFSVEVTRRIQRPVDVIMLNSASLSFAYHVIRKGICLYESKTVDRILYEVTLHNKYQDFMPFIKELRAIKREKLVGRN
jgi:uncharacterized protein